VVAVLRGNNVIYMDSVETTKTVRVVSRVGAMLPAHCTAVGKIQLAALPIDEIERLYPDPALKPLTDKTLKTRDALIADLKSIAEKGYAIEHEESELDVKGIAVPVRDFSRKVIAAVGIVAPAHRIADPRLDRDGIVSLVQEAGKALSQKMGFIVPAAKKTA
jgi:DNA-binding IclR family transcriptional regulator